jgi:hypothetical protein
MPKKSASTIATGGAGYTFADKVAAAFLAQMLQRGFPFEPELGIIEQIHFETHESGNLLDDLQLVLRNGNDIVNCTASVKSNRQLSKAGFNSEFVKDAWEQWGGAAGSKFNPATDILCLIAGGVDDQALQAWRELQKQARATTPERLLERLADENQFSAIQRAVFKSLGNPDGGSDIDTALVASRVRLLHFSDSKEGDYINRCADVVLDGTQREAAKLWSRLVKLAAENRGTGGYLDLPKLISVLRADFELRDFPDYRNDWDRLERISSENINAVRTVVGSDIHLVRQREKDALAAEVAEHRAVALVGDSGTGKSAVLAESMGMFKRVLWLSAAQLSKPSQAELATACSLTYDIPALIGHSTLQGCVLVLDSFEHLEGEARHRAIQLMKSLKDQDFIGWKLIITSQPQFWGGVQDVLLQTGINDFRKLDVEKPAAKEILAAVRHLPSIRGLLLRTDLQPFLCNLVVLDWVLRGDIARRLSLPQAHIGETDVIQRIWERWVGDTDMRFARDALLRLIAESEGERLSGVVHIESIPRDQLPLAGTLADEGLLRVTAPSVQFAHDLMGDWARFRILVFAGHNAPQKIRDLASVPRWSRAIRLYAQSLVEQGSGLEQWKLAIKEIGGDASEAQLASDLFLDGLLFAANSQLLLEQVWQDLIGDDGQILRRLLMRLIHVASFPDWRLQLVTEAKDADQMAAWFRVPLPLYWYPALRVLSAHAGEVVKRALIPAAEACALWLRTMPSEMPGRQEAALLAIALARETQDLIAERMHFGGKDKVIYEALLWAGKDLPEEVTQIALELAGRRDEPDHAIKRAVEAQERQAKFREEWTRKHPEREQVRHVPPTIPSRAYGPIRPPDSDGPLREVDEGFRSAVLDTPALSGLIATRPEAAREVLLAVCIDEPKAVELHRNPLPFDGLGLSHWQHGYPAMYWKGSFLKFLQEAPEQGLDAIVRLANYATERWFETGMGTNSKEVDRNEYSLEFEVGEREIFWLGDGNVYAWNRYLSIDGDIVECALMALEKWFSDELENGRNIGGWIDYIFARGTSLAFAGVLVSVGLRFQELFLDKLQPLLGNFYLYQIQMSLALAEQNGSWKISWTKQPENVLRLASEWHDKPHRQILLRDIASTLMLQDEATKCYLTTRKAEWAKLPLSEKGKLDMEFFLARFDPANYTKTPQDDGRVLVMMKWPPHLQKVADQSQEENAVRLLALSMAQRARRLLEGQVTIRPEDLEAFAKQVQLLANWQDTRSGGVQEHYRINSLAGGLAVLVILHRDWLSKHSELETWCFDTLRNLMPIWPEHSSPISISDHGAEVFLGEIAVALLPESSEEWVLRLAFNGVTGWEYNSTLFTVWRAYLLLDKLGDRFGELVNVMVIWSALRMAAIRESKYHRDGSQLAKYKDLLFQRYLAGKLKGTLIPLLRIEKLGRRLVERIERRSMPDWEKRSRKWAREQRDHKLYRQMPDLDLQVIQKGFGFVAGMIRYPVAAENQLLKDYVRELFDLEMRSLPRADADDERSEIESTPYEYDIWVMERVAEYVVRTNSVEMARQFYRPILDLGPAARYWVEDFLQSWFSRGLPISTDLGAFTQIWQDMVQYAESLKAWQPGEGNYWSRAEGLATHLMGLSYHSITVLGDPRYKGLVSSMSGAFERWCTRWLRYSSAASWFAYFLRTESGSVLRPQGIKQLAATVALFQERDWHRNDLGALFTEVLSSTWKDLQKEIERDAALQQAFLRVLAVLCARQIPESLNLRAKVSQVLSVG